MKSAVLPSTHRVVSPAAFTALLLLVLPLAGCASWFPRTRHEANSVVQFLYPNKDQPFIQPQTPTLRLPLRVGVAFVPPANHGVVYARLPALDETEKTELLRRVGAQFKNLPFVQTIEIVPTTYLRPGGGFENLDQLRALMGIDVMVLVAYDQAQNSRDNEWSITYWTIAGIYTAPARKNETHTLMEAVVYDVASRSLLFRAPGTSSVSDHSTLFRAEQNLRADARTGFTQAAEAMTVALQHELEAFKIRIKDEPATVRVENKPGYNLAGALDGWFVMGLLIAGAGLAWRDVRSGSEKAQREDAR